MKRRILSLALVVLMIFSLSSCLFDKEPEGFMSNRHSLEYSYSEDDFIKAKEEFTRLPNMLTTPGQFDLIYDIYLDLDSYVSELATYQNIEYLKTSIEQNDDSNKKYLDFNSKLKELIDLERDFLRKAKNSIYKDDFYKGMSDDEIDSMLGITYPDEYYTLDEEVEKLLVDYRKLSRSEKKEQAPAMYSRVVDNYNKMARLAGYNNYLDFAYPNIYDRSYKPIDSVSFSNYVRDYIVPELMEADSELDRTIASLVDADKRALISLINNPISDDKDKLDSYAKFMGGPFYLIYEALWDHGYYYFSNSTKAIEGAYTTYLPSLNTPALYFGPGYQSIMTVCHEFGHYFSYVRNDGRGGSFDLAETQSQGNELIFVSYLEQSQFYTKATLKAFRDYQLHNYLSTIVMATIVNDFEYRVYTENILDPNMYDIIFKEVLEKFGSYDELKDIFGIAPEDYWKMVALDNAGYYISYAVSLVPSIELYLMASDDINLAKDSFFKLTNKVYVEDDYEKTLENASLISPFKKEAYLEIPSLF